MECNNTATATSITNDGNEVSLKSPDLSKSGTSLPLPSPYSGIPVGNSTNDLTAASSSIPTTTIGSTQPSFPWMHSGMSQQFPFGYPLLAMGYPAALQGADGNAPPVGANTFPNATLTTGSLASLNPLQALINYHQQVGNMQLLLNYNEAMRGTVCTTSSPMFVWLFFLSLSFMFRMCTVS